MRLAQPPGIRTTYQPSSSGRGGQWEPCRRGDGGTPFYDEQRAFFDELAEADQVMLRAELLEKLRAGEAGRLVYGPASSDDVCLMANVGFVLELRLSDYGRTAPGDPLGEPQLRHTRLYFTEPEDTRAGELVLLLLESKFPGPMGKEEQNEHAKVAARRADEHCRYRNVY